MISSSVRTETNQNLTSLAVLFVRCAILLIYISSQALLFTSGLKSGLQYIGVACPSLLLMRAFDEINGYEMDGGFVQTFLASMTNVVPQP